VSGSGGGPDTAYCAPTGVYTAAVTSATQIVGDLERAGYVTKTRVGRRNRYGLQSELPLRHPQHRHRTIGELIGFLASPAEPDPTGT
jgi:hypothetical protein